MSVGIPGKELSALFHAAHQGFNHQKYGFTGFEELINLAQDKGMVRIDADVDRGLRVFPGPDLHTVELPPEGAAHVEVVESLPAEEAATEPAKRRRRPTRSRRSSGPRRRSPRSKKQEAPAPAAES